MLVYIFITYAHIEVSLCIAGISPLIIYVHERATCVCKVVCMSVIRGLFAHHIQDRVDKLSTLRVMALSS